MLRRGLGFVDGLLGGVDDGLLRGALLLERGLLPLGRGELFADGRERAFALREQLLHALARLVERGLELAALDLAHADAREHAQHAELALAQGFELEP